MTTPESWLTPEQLAAELGQTVRWVKTKMASGEIPSVKLGMRRFFTPECRAQLVAAQLKPAKASTGWARPARSK